MALIDLSPFNNILQRLEGVADRLERGAGAGGAAPAPAAAVAGGGGGEIPAIAKSFDEFLFSKLPPLDAAAKDTGSTEVAASTEAIVSSFRMLRGIIAATGFAKKPKDDQWAAIFKPLAELSQKAGKACDNRNDFFQAQKAGAESLGVVQCVMGNTPGSHVRGVFETCDFHLVKVMQKKNPPETAWAKLVKELLKGLEEWCIANAKMGFTWKFDGQDAAEYFAKNPIGSGGSGAAAAAPKATAPAPKAGGMGAIFGAIQGKDATGLKKVTDDMKTKNRSKDDEAPGAPAPKAKAAAAKTHNVDGRRKGPKGAPVVELQRDTNWVIENQEGVSNLSCDEADVTQNILVVNCREITLQVKNKVKAISIDGCEKVNVICGDVLSTVELVNSDKCKVQTIGKINSVAIDKCNGVNIFLSKQSIGAELITSKSSEMNVTIPEGDDGDIIEMPIPEQFVTKVVGKKLATQVSHIYG